MGEWVWWIHIHSLFDLFINMQKELARHWKQNQWRANSLIIKLCI